MRGVNKVILLGTVGRDPEVRSLGASGSTVTSISLATSEAWKDKVTGEKQEKTEWHRVVCFNRLGEIAGEYVRKGTKLYIEGSLRTRKWQDQQGQDKYTTEIIANDIQMLDSKGSSSSNFDDIQQAPFMSTNQNTAKQQPTPAPQNAFDQLDDDVPF